MTNNFTPEITKPQTHTWPKLAI